MKKVVIPVERLIMQADAAKRAEYVRNLIRPLKDTHEDILNFKMYFKSYNPLPGIINGPEEKGGKIYISIYHFMEYNGINPELYYTLNIGLYFYENITKDVISCFYTNYPHKIDKYDYEIIKRNQHIFKNFLK